MNCVARCHLKYLLVDGRIILKFDIKGIEWNEVEYIILGQGRDKWWGDGVL
jgi:hypothetical protein